MSLIDTHAHLNFPAFKADFNHVVDKITRAGVTTVINVSSSLEESFAVVRLENPKLKMFSTVGIHPHEAPKYTTQQEVEGAINQLHKIYSDHQDQVVGIGECGLDYFFREEPEGLETIKKLQEQLFQAQINLAKKLKLPLIVHSRDSGEEIFEFDYSGVTGVFHSFSSDWETAKKVLGMGFYLGINCTITYPKNDHLREVVKNAPLDRLLTETDSPLLPPQTQRGQRNDPSNIVEVVKVISDIKEVSVKETAEAIFNNANKLFLLVS